MFEPITLKESVIVGPLLEGVVDWFATAVSDILDKVSVALVDNFSFDLNYFSNTFPFVGAAADVIRYFGLALLFLLVVWQIFKAFGGKYTDSEAPIPLVGKACLSAFAIFYSYDIFSWLLELATTPYNIMKDTNPAGITAKLPDNMASAITGGALRVLGFGTGVGTLIALILALVIAWMFFKLLLEVVERYVVLGVLYYTSPLAFALGASKSTSDVFKNWCRMVASQFVVIIMNIWFLRGISAGIGAWIGSLMVGSFADIVAGYLMLLAFMRVAQHFDEYLSTLGLHSARTGGGIAQDLVAFGMIARSAGSAISRTFNPGGAGAMFGRAGGVVGARQYGLAGGIFRGESPMDTARGNAYNGTRNGDRGLFGRTLQHQAMNDIKRGGANFKDVAGLMNEPLNMGRNAANNASIGALRDASAILPGVFGKDGQNGIKFNSSQQINSSGRMFGTGTDAQGREFQVMATNVRSGYRPTGDYRIATGADGSQYYIEATGDGAKGLFGAPVFSDDAGVNASQAQQFFPNENTAGMTFANTDEEGVISATDANGNNSMLYSGDMYEEPAGAHGVLTDEYGNNWYQMDAPDDMSGMTEFADADALNAASPDFGGAGENGIYDSEALPAELAFGDEFGDGAVLSPVYDNDGNIVAGALAVGGYEGAEIGDDEFTVFDSNAFGGNIPEGAEEIGDTGWYKLANEGATSDELVGNMLNEQVGADFDSGYVGDTVKDLQSGGFADAGYDSAYADSRIADLQGADGYNADAMYEPVLDSEGNAVPGAFIATNADSSSYALVDGETFAGEIPEGAEQIGDSGWYAIQDGSGLSSDNFVADVENGSIGDQIRDMQDGSMFNVGEVAYDDDYAQSRIAAFNESGFADPNATYSPVVDSDGNTVAGAMRMTDENGNNYAIVDGDTFGGAIPEGAEQIGDTGWYQMPTAAVVSTTYGEDGASDIAGRFTQGAVTEGEVSSRYFEGADNLGGYEATPGFSYDDDTNAKQIADFFPHNGGDSAGVAFEYGAVASNMNIDGAEAGSVVLVTNDDGSQAVVTRDANYVSDGTQNSISVKDKNGDTWSYTPVPDGENAQNFAESHFAPSGDSLYRGNDGIASIEKVDATTGINEGAYHVTTKSGEQETWVDTSRFNTKGGGDENMGEYKGTIKDAYGHEYARYSGKSKVTELPTVKNNEVRGHGDKTGVESFVDKFGGRLDDYSRVDYSQKDQGIIVAHKNDGTVEKYADAARYSGTGRTETVSAKGKNGSTHDYVKISGVQSVKRVPVMNDSGEVSYDEKGKVVTRETVETRYNGDVKPIDTKRKNGTRRTSPNLGSNTGTAFGHNNQSSQSRGTMTNSTSRLDSQATSSQKVNPPKKKWFGRKK